MEFRVSQWNLQKLMKLMIMNEITYPNAVKQYTNVLKNIYIIQVYHFLGQISPKLETPRRF